MLVAVENHANIAHQQPSRIEYTDFAGIDFQQAILPHLLEAFDFIGEISFEVDFPVARNLVDVETKMTGEMLDYVAAQRVVFVAPVAACNR